MLVTSVCHTLLRICSEVGVCVCVCGIWQIWRTVTSATRVLQQFHYSSQHSKPPTAAAAVCGHWTSKHWCSCTIHPSWHYGLIYLYSCITLSLSMTFSSENYHVSISLTSVLLCPCLLPTVFRFRHTVFLGLLLYCFGLVFFQLLR